MFIVTPIFIHSALRRSALYLGWHISLLRSETGLGGTGAINFLLLRSMYPTKKQKLRRS